MYKYCVVDPRDFGAERNIPIFQASLISKDNARRGSQKYPFCLLLNLLIICVLFYPYLNFFNFQMHYFLTFSNGFYNRLGLAGFWYLFQTTITKNTNKISVIFYWHLLEIFCQYNVSFCTRWQKGEGNGMNISLLMEEIALSPNLIITIHRELAAWKKYDAISKSWFTLPKKILSMWM